jgi:hypothetical protein
MCAANPIPALRDVLQDAADVVRDDLARLAVKLGGRGLCAREAADTQTAIIDRRMQLAAIQTHLDAVAGPAPGGDLVRVLRVVEYVGPRDAVERQVASSLHGERSLSNGLVIRAATLGEFPEILSNLAPAGFGRWSV